MSAITKHFTAKTSSCFMVFGLVVFLMYLWFFVGFDSVFVVVQNVNPANYVFFYGSAVAALLLVMFFWVASWKTLLADLSIRLSFKNAFGYYWSGYFLDLLVPSQQVCGEAARIYLVQKKTQNSYGAIAAAGITNRIVNYSVVTVGLSVGAVYLLLRSTLPPFALGLLVLSWIGALIYLGILLYLALNKNAANNIANFALKLLRFLRIKRFKTQTLPAKLVDSLQSFNAGFQFFRENPRRLIKPYIFQILSYTLYLAVYVLVFYALGLNYLFLDFFIVVYFLAGTVQDATAAFSVGGLEILLTSIFIFYGVEPAQSGVAAAMLRSVTFWLPVIAGYLIVQIVGAKHILASKFHAQVQTQQQKPPPPSSFEPDRPPTSPASPE
ncbi:MAG: flippase-like domain-containing protein [Candidatus Bathyarchaeota archaeon]|nr:flippase-like domain-containing protein [Candidatus Bathyarchaeota archaeon]